MLSWEAIMPRDGAAKHENEHIKTSTVSSLLRDWMTITNVFFQAVI
jgi:hypothetical protein